MLEGLWTVIFESNFGTLGTGVGVFVSRRILGGDNQYYYIGDVNIDNNIVSCSINVKQFNKQYGSIFGDIDSFNLIVSGEIKGDQMELKGHMVENPNLKITIKCIKIIDI